MNKYVRLVLSIVLACITLTVAATAATEQDKLTAIQNGLANLAPMQQANGSWIDNNANGTTYTQAPTAATLLAFASQTKNWPPADQAAYQLAVNNAVAYLLANASTISVSTRDDGVDICPGGTGSCTGVYWDGEGEATYTTGLVASGLGTYAAGNAGAVATTSGPLAGMTWTQIAQGITNVFSASQASAIDGNREGGWRYFIPGNGDADSSTTQWAVLSLIFDQSLGATTPAAVGQDLQVWLGNAQAADGSGCYQPGYICDDNSDTGSILLGLNFLGTPLSNTAVQSALAFLNSAWQTLPNNTWYGNFGHPYAMWADYKALEVTISLTNTTYITNLLTDCGYGRGHPPGNPPGSVPCNWWEDYNEWLVLNQAGDGSWPGYAYWTPPLSTAWDVSILGAALIPVSTCNFNTVYLDSTHKCSFTVTNKTTSTVTITAITITPGPGTDANAYSYFTRCSTLGPGKSCMIQVFFYADAVGTLTATLNVSSSSPVTPQQATLTGNVIDPAAQFSPTSLKFGRQAVGTSTTLPLQLTNTGLTNLAIDNFAISGVDAGDFSQTNNCPAALAPTASCTITVTFAPQAKGCPRKAVLTFTDNVIGGTKQVTLGGSAY